MSLQLRLSCLLFALAALMAAPAWAQTNTTQIAQAQKQLADANAHVKKIEGDISLAKDKVKVQLRTKPEWANVGSEQTKAAADMKAAQRATQASLDKNPAYQAAIKQREDARKIRQRAQAPATPGDDDKVTTAELAEADDAFIKASFQMKTMEKQALADSQPYNDAVARLDAANGKLAQMDAEADEVLKADMNYQQLQQSLVQAQDAVTQAKQELQNARQTPTNPNKPPTPRKSSKQ